MRGTRYHLELAVQDLRPGRVPDRALDLRKVGPAEAGLAGWLYCTVGAAWNWTDRAAWSDDQWSAHLSREHVQLWVALEGDQPAGYFEIRTEAGDRAEIVAFGLVPSYIARGLGGHLLTLAVGKVAEAGARVVWLHTSSRDHPRALANYRARGFRITGQEAL